MNEQTILRRLEQTAHLLYAHATGSEPLAQDSAANYADQLYQVAKQLEEYFEERRQELNKLKAKRCAKCQS